MAVQAISAFVGVAVLTFLGYKCSILTANYLQCLNYSVLGPMSSLTAVRRLQEASPSAAASNPSEANVTHFTAGNASEANLTQPCLCVFDIDRTLTGRQNDLTTCPRNKVMTGVKDWAYPPSGGQFTLSALAAEGINNTFCGQCYLGICSSGVAGGENSSERQVFLDKVLKTPLYDALRAKVSSASRWSVSDKISSPLVLEATNTRKQYSIEGIRSWYQQHDIAIPSGNVYFFGDRRENIPPFAHLGFNARETSCESRDPILYHGSRMVGYCGATPEEIVAEKGVVSC